ncbi:MAG: hypothetical protein C4516_05550 [Oxalobacter sp.]|nr:MAG: hypothetical protein C4516_05550 [Oxalobacter sp.]
MVVSVIKKVGAVNIPYRVQKILRCQAPPRGLSQFEALENRGQQFYFAKQNLLCPRIFQVMLTPIVSGGLQLKNIQTAPYDANSWDSKKPNLKKPSLEPLL